MTRKQDQAGSSNRSGFSLVEVIVAAGILSLVVLGVLAATNGSFMADRAAANTTRSQAIARHAMEECLNTLFDDLLNLDGDTTTVDGFTVDISVVQSSVDLRIIEVTVDKPAAPGSRTRLLMLRSAR